MQGPFSMRANQSYSQFLTNNLEVSKTENIPVLAVKKYIQVCSIKSGVSMWFTFTFFMCSLRDHVKNDISYLLTEQENLRTLGQIVTQLACTLGKYLWRDKVHRCPGQRVTVAR